MVGVDPKTTLQRAVDRRLGGKSLGETDRKRARSERYDKVAEGPAGADGATGPTGPTGVAGADGATGPTGLPGSVGAEGATGPTGPTGVSGAAGAAGATGATGPTGAAGTFAGLATNGIVAQTATTPTFAARTITGTANEVEVTNGNGVAGNPTIGLPDSVTIATALTLAGKAINTATGVGVVSNSAVKSYTGTSVSTTTTTLATASITLVNGIVYDVIGWAGAQGSAPSTGFLDLIINVAAGGDVTGSRCGTASGERPIFAFDTTTVTGTGASVSVVMKAKTTTSTGTVQSGLVVAVAIPRGPVLG